jgi:hypothetical protein
VGFAFFDQVRASASIGIDSAFGVSSQLSLNGVIAYSSTISPWISASIEVTSASAPSLSRNNSYVFLLGSSA